MIKKITSIYLIVMMLLAVSGCANKGVTPPQESAKQQVGQDAVAAEKAVMYNYNALLQKKDVTVPELIKYIDENIGSISQAGASSMIIGLEKVQKEKLPKLQDKFGDSEAVPKALTKIYANGLTSQAISSIENQETKDLLFDAQSNGFKIETAEGMYFPVIDYSAYKKYRNAVTQDITAYIDIMAVESDKTPIKDAALMISWSEIIKRAQEQERYIKDYGNSAKVEDMKQLLKRYTVFAMYGANNTPLFSYDTKQMIPEAKKTYLETGFDANKGSFSKVMNEYLAVLKKNYYKLTPEVQEYRNKASEEIR
ncbi:hypothetical protein SOV_52080 [Sporomusa ovata DSM 2662]|uniref:Lipoprotein n=1 Tax=Sporomusa ovata TaxID=2378 RepID=A0A0U1L3E8_9FIRM|nr:hypothetical protein [Sporomusa ovata]EQB27580.1 hypothetical protein SOV_2c04770 [Sporomusa ovata DSM 2662]CQR73434.1 hypothetical protein SpAn4DRAFT_2666 [Sporomusa ovata]